MVAASQWRRRVRGSGMRRQLWSADEACLAVDQRRWIRAEKKEGPELDNA